MSEETLRTWQPWLACTAHGPPQESLVRDETKISLPVNPSLTRMTLCQLCVAPRTSRSRPVMTEPGREPRVSGGHCATREAHLLCFKENRWGIRAYKHWVAAQLPLFKERFLALAVTEPRLTVTRSYGQAHACWWMQGPITSDTSVMKQAGSVYSG